MARARNIKPGLFLNEYLGTCDPLEVLFFEGLWCQADREGRLECRPLRLKAQIFPYRENVTAQVISGFIANLSEQGFLTHYTVGKHEYIQINSFLEHQNPHKNEKPSEIPPPPAKTTACEDSGNFSKAPDFIGNAPASSHDSLNPSSHDSQVTPETPEGDPGASPDEKPRAQKFKFAPLHADLAKRMAEPVQRNHPGQPINPDEWADAVRKLIELDGRAESEIMPLWTWVTNHRTAKFSWADNCRTPMKLRDKDSQGMKYWDVIQNQRQRDSGQPRASPKQAGLHSFDNVDYSKGVNPDGSF